MVKQRGGGRQHHGWVQHGQDPPPRLPTQRGHQRLEGRVGWALSTRQTPGAPQRDTTLLLGTVLSTRGALPHCHPVEALLVFSHGQGWGTELAWNPGKGAGGPCCGPPQAPQAPQAHRGSLQCTTGTPRHGHPKPSVPPTHTTDTPTSCGRPTDRGHPTPPHLPWASRAAWAPSGPPRGTAPGSHTARPRRSPAAASPWKQARCLCHLGKGSRLT